MSDKLKYSLINLPHGLNMQSLKPNLKNLNAQEQFMSFHSQGQWTCLRISGNLTLTWRLLNKTLTECETSTLNFWARLNMWKFGSAMLALNQTQLMTPTGQESCSIRLTNTLRQMSLNLRKNVSSFWKTGLNLNRHQSLEETKKSRQRLRQSCPRESRKEGRLRWSIKRQGKK